MKIEKNMIDIAFKMDQKHPRPAYNITYVDMLIILNLKMHEKLTYHQFETYRKVK